MKQVACNLCGNAEARELYPATLPENHTPAAGSAFMCTSPDYGQHYRIVQCPRCGLVFANPRGESPEILDAYQAVEDPVYLRERRGRELTFRKHLTPLHRITGAPNGRRLLDVGAYIGVFVQVAREAGWEAVGLEPSTWAVQKAGQAGLPVSPGTLADCDFAPDSFDVITLWDVIEHFGDPAGELVHVRRLLRPGGFVVIHTIDIDSPTARWMGAGWPFLMEMHVVFFSRRTLRAMLERLGFRYVSDHTAGRYLRLGYLTGRVTAAFGPRLGSPIEKLVQRLGLAGKPVPINTLDLFTAYAQKP